MDNKPTYICDPEKNINCKGRNKPDWCGSECYMTIHKEFAKDAIKAIEEKASVNRQEPQEGVKNDKRRSKNSFS